VRCTRIHLVIVLVMATIAIANTWHSQMLRFEYLWQDSENFKRPTKMSAPEYVEHLMSWVQGNIDNEQMFPSRIGRIVFPFFSCSSPLGLTNLLSFLRGSISQNVPEPSAADFQTTVPCICAYLLPPLFGGCASGTWAAPKYELQALCSVHR
jgi:Mob1/phocein family